MAHDAGPCGGIAVFDPERLDAAFANVARQVEDGSVPAAVLGVARGDGIVRVQAFEAPRGDRAQADSVFLLASITKPILACAVLQLVEAGRLSLRAPLRAYLPEFRVAPPGPGLPGADLVTVQQLLSHTSGIVDPPEAVMWRHPGRADLLNYALTAPLRFLPGTRYEYASVTFYLLGELIRRLSGLDYPEYLDERVFRPLGMADTGFVPRDAARVTWPHFEADGPENEAVIRRFIGAGQPGAGLWATARDVLAFGMAMLGGGALGDPDADLVLVYLTNVWGADERHAVEAFGGVLGALAW